MSRRESHNKRKLYEDKERDDNKKAPPENDEEEDNSLTLDSDTFSSADIIQQFDPGVQPKVNLDSTITVYGKRRTGKSVFGKWFLQPFRKEIPWVWVFTLTKFNSWYATFIPDKFIMSDFSADVLYNIMKRQKKAVKMYLKQMEEGNPDPINPLALLIWDDYMGNDIRFNKMLHRYYYTGRHFATFNLFMTQYVKETPPPIRSNTDIAVLFNTDHRTSLEIYAEDFAGRMGKRDFIDMFLRVASEPHSFFVIENDPNCPYNKKFYRGKAEVLEADISYIMGSAEFWQGSEKQLNDIISGKMKRRLEIRGKLSEHKEHTDIKTLQKQKKPKFVSDVRYPDPRTNKNRKLPDIHEREERED